MPSDCLDELLFSVVGGLELGWWNVPDGGVEPGGFPPVNPAEDGHDIFDGPRRSLHGDELDVGSWAAHAAWPWLTHWSGGDGEVALDHARRGIEAAERVGGGFARAQAYGGLAEAHLLRGEWDDALTACGQALAIMQGNHIALESEPLVHTRIARAHLGAGRVAEARPAAEMGLRLSRERGHRIAEVQARTALAQVLLAGSSPDSARIRSELGEARALAERTGFQSYQPQIRLHLAELARLTGDEATTAQAFDLAYHQFSAIGAEGWLKNMTAARWTITP